MVTIRQMWLWALISCAFAFIGALAHGEAMSRASDHSAGVIWLALTLTFIGKRSA